jgi:hypothetical protein
MIQLLIQLQQSIAHEACALCGGPIDSAEGPALCRADSLKPVCRKCGKANAPWLTALMDLACTAERVGRIKRHTIVPPLTSLLDLARAAEDYTVSRPVRQAA